MTEKALTLKGMTEGSGCTARTVRYYEREGLLRASRSRGGHRLFAPVELERLRLVIQLREAGWALDEVTEFLAVRERPNTDVEAWTRFDHLIAVHIERLERKIEVLSRLRVDLGSTAALLPVCRACVQPAASDGGEVARRDCQQCDRLPDTEALPASFRLAWRGRAAGDASFDEPGADALAELTLAEPDDDDDAAAERGR